MSGGANRGCGLSGSSRIFHGFLMEGGVDIGPSSIALPQAPWEEEPSATNAKMRGARGAAEGDVGVAARHQGGDVTLLSVPFGAVGAVGTSGRLSGVPSSPELELTPRQLTSSARQSSARHSLSGTFQEPSGGLRDPSGFTDQLFDTGNADARSESPDMWEKPLSPRQKIDFVAAEKSRSRAAARSIASRISSAAAEPLRNTDIVSDVLPHSNLPAAEHSVQEPSRPSKSSSSSGRKSEVLGTSSAPLPATSTSTVNAGKVQAIDVTSAEMTSSQTTGGRRTTFAVQRPKGRQPGIQAASRRASGEYSRSEVSQNRSTSDRIFQRIPDASQRTSFASSRSTMHVDAAARSAHLSFDGGATSAAESAEASTPKQNTGRWSQVERQEARRTLAGRGGGQTHSEPSQMSDHSVSAITAVSHQISQVSV